MPRQILKNHFKSADMRTVIALNSRSLKSFFSNKSSFGFSRCCSRMDNESINLAESITSTEHSNRFKNIREFIPKLSPDLYKGQCGRVGVIGGSFEYTGAPYFAAISSLKLGVDMVHVFCCREAGPVIKSYSPELIVHPFLDRSNVVSDIAPWLERLHALVIGPGMGRDADLLNNVKNIITHCNQMQSPLPLVIDADGLHLITENLNLVKDYKGVVVLTPNVVEFSRLSSKLGEQDPFKIANALNAVLLQKGHKDIITNGIHNDTFNVQMTLTCDVPGSNRRCGGQGDVLSGCIGGFVAWLQIYLAKKSLAEPNRLERIQNNMELFNETFILYSWAVYGACVITRTCSRLAFEQKGRGMTSSDMISYVDKVFKLYFGM